MRPIIRWHGGKALLGKWIEGFIPPHLVYVEPFGGAASVLTRKPAAALEVLNDLDVELVNLYHVLADPELWKEFWLAVWLEKYDPASVAKDRWKPVTPIERAVRLVGRGGMCRNAASMSGFRGFKMRPNGTYPIDDWRRYRTHVPRFHRRLRDVVIESRPAVDVMLQYDGPETMHYVDPPYLPSTRKTPRHRYAHEMTEADHVDLLAVLTSLEGMVVLSGYAHPIYDEALQGWQRVTKTANDNGRKKRVEVLWVNPAAVAANVAHKEAMAVAKERDRISKKEAKRLAKTPGQLEMFG